MPARKPTTKAGQQKAVKRVMDEWKAGTLRSSSGRKVTSRDQALAIALNESGQAKPRKKGK